ncbi:MAG: competence/damage-inducible protein A [Bdellovibrionaceae bacterium]|nr:competence/damage-inducible protein A [Pseudobdellovibrionaceae bacterium]
MFKAAVFSIGTEITDGQITDSNSKWISKKLTEYGVDVLLHASLPDDQKQIIDFLNTNTTAFNIILICGGLGPTSDDLTRYAVSEHLGLTLQLDSASWDLIQNKLKNKSVILREGHKMQAMIPTKSLALINNLGIAPGIHITHNSKNYFLLPGPPAELQSIWNDNIDSYFKKLNIQNNRKLKLWQCQGIAESELAHLTDTFFKSYSFVIKTGFRIHKPNVEIKIWHTDVPETKKAFDEFELLIKKYLIVSENQKSN